MMANSWQGSLFSTTEAAMAAKKAGKKKAKKAAKKKAKKAAKKKKNGAGGGH
jgi:hypothetical protein